MGTAIVSSSSPSFSMSVRPVRTVASTASYSSSWKNPLVFRSVSQPRKQSRSLRISTSTFRKSTVITCGAIVEISESEFPNTVLKSDRRILVEFVANWCGPCRLISPAIEWVAQEYGDRLTVVKIDHDANPRLIEEYKVYGLPTLILFKNGQEVPESRREGAITKVKLKEYLDVLLESLSVT